jgi:Domain of unknown function (DUF6916)
MTRKTIVVKTLDRYQGSDFMPHLNQVFCIHQEGFEPVELELVRVTEESRAPLPGARQPFSLLFLGPISNQYLVQHIYHLENEQMGALDLFIVPLGLESGRMRYEAIFS